MVLESRNLLEVEFNDSYIRLVVDNLQWEYIKADMVSPDKDFIRLNGYVAQIEQGEDGDSEIIVARVLSSVFMARNRIISMSCTPL